MADDQNLEVQNPEGAGAEAVVPEWIPEKFRSNPEKFGEAYSNLEREYHQTRQDLRAQQEQLEELIALQNQAPAPEQVSTDAIYQAYENDPIATMQYLAQQAVQQAVQTVTQSQEKFQQPLVEQQNQLLAYTANQMVSQKVPDWENYRDRVAEEISKNPDLLPESALSTPDRAAAALERVYKQVRHDDLLNQNKTLAEQQADLQRQAKLAAQTLTGPAGRPAPTDADVEAWERVKNAPSASYSNLVNGR